MSYRELLESAAKAAGIERGDPLGLGIEPYFIRHGSVFQSWDPLNDDGDALKLAVKLRLWVQVSERSVWVAQNADEIFGAMAASTLVMFSECGNDPYVATRRAIVLAAASIGQQEK